jgi:hypothetical protein
MPNAPANLKQADIARVIRAAQATGAPEVEVRIGNATITIKTGTTPQSETVPVDEEFRI